jgi:hypothetical protein
MTGIDQKRSGSLSTIIFEGSGVSFLLVVALLLSCLGCGQSTGTTDPVGSSAAAARVFEAASTVEETLRQHNALPDPAEKIWWDVNGPDMLWNNKNLHQIVPTVNVYRDGPVRELSYHPMAEVAGYQVETPAGKMPFQDFLVSQHSSTMGVVIVHRGKIVFESLALPLLGVLWGYRPTDGSNQQRWIERLPHASSRIAENGRRITCDAPLAIFTSALGSDYAQDYPPSIDGLDQ